MPMPRSCAPRPCTAPSACVCRSSAARATAAIPPAATVAGAVIGGAIGRRMDRNNGSAGTRCRTVEVERDERRIIGYDVEYQYKGDTYMSRVDYDPGSRLRIRVSVSPDENANYVH